MKIIENNEFVILVDDNDNELYKARYKMSSDEKLIYVASPLSAPTKEGIVENAKKALGYMDKVYNCERFGRAFEGKVRVPYAPHAFITEFLDDTIPEQRALAIEFCNRMLSHTNVLVWCGDEITDGMQNEIDAARNAGKPILHLPFKN